MITEKKLKAALDKIDRRNSRAHGLPMSGLSIPARHYLGAKNVTVQRALGVKPSPVKYAPLSRAASSKRGGR